MEFDEIVVKESPGLCRCCLSEGCYKDMGTEYSWMSENEVYAEMLLECFDISISQHNEGPNGPNRLICEVCITRLRDACYFKKQVLDSEKKFVDMVGRGEFKSKVIVYQTQLKTERPDELDVTIEPGVEYLDDEMDFGDDDLPKPDEPSVSEVTADPLPVRKRGRPRKTTLKPETKKKLKVERKAKTVVKEHKMQYREISEASNKEDLSNILRVILENSTVMPFRWCASKYMCFFCGCVYEECSELKLHTRIEHENPNLDNVLKYLNTNKVKLDISEIACKLCSKEISDLDDFLSHAAKIHDLKFNHDLRKALFSFRLADSKMKCLECDEQFEFFRSLLIHFHRHHRPGLFICEICGQNFVSKSNVVSHIRHVHDKIQCEICSKMFSTAYIKIHNEKEHLRDKLKCPKCPEVLGSRYLRKQHIALAHQDGEKYKCDECAKVFAFKSKLLEHAARVHLKEKSVSCEICGFKVFNKESLARHMVRHDDSRPFECDICKKCFQRKKTLILHRRIHTNDRRYSCKECGKAFVQVTSLKLHLRVHH